MAERVTTPSLRFRFVEKTTAQVGSLTDYPVQITLGQAAEIFHRVRNASWYSGSIDIQYGTAPFDDHYEIFIPSISQPAPLIQEVVNLATPHASKRGYAFKKKGVADEFGNLLYEQTMVAGADDYYDADYQSGAYDPDDVWRDGKSREASIHASDLVEWDNLDGGVTTGFSFLSVAEGGGTDPASSGVYAFDSRFNFIGNENTFAYVIFSGEIAWVDVNGSGNPIDPLNELYLGVEFKAVSTPMLDVTSISTKASGDPNAVSASIKFILRLSNSDLVCDLEISPFIFILGTYDSHTGTDFVLLADTWWPSAKNSPAVPVWDTTTGAKL
jgi:hypothetical protein